MGQINRFIKIILICACWSVIISVHADEADDTWDLANGLYVRGEVYYKEAIEQYRLFLEKFPSDPRLDLAMFRLAEIYRKQKNFSEALVLYHEHQRFTKSLAREKVDFRIGQMYYF